MAQYNPPFLPGLPVLGNALDFSRDANALLWRGYQELGPIFSIRLVNKPAAVLVGPENLKFFFEQTDQTLSMEEVYQFLKPMFGEKIFFASGPEVYQQQRAIMLPAFAARRMPAYLQAMRKEVLAWLVGFNRPPRKTFIVHGEPEAATSLAGKIRGRLGWEPCQRTGR